MGYTIFGAKIQQKNDIRKIFDKILAELRKFIKNILF